ncbi:bZIP transcription factor ABI5 homolog isoform X1 [Zingiber officinale]|uniref:bZIP transcription factor ABI5 homolog isoform X1 n=2 Tax=Zingiber officinale TaxID=94328 RepID=UPI001C4B54F7|nr:bZIP transcription factor ABI5 homolog isoform X1 [Zingiber officinale]
MHTILPPLYASVRSNEIFVIVSRSVDMASPTEIRNMTAEDAEVTSEHRKPEPIHRQLFSGEEEDQKATAPRAFDLDFPLMRQTSIYSLTLDEIQNAVCEPGKTFGSMNMDEFLTNIWNVEEVQATAAVGNLLQDDRGVGMAQQTQPLRRQGSITVPQPLSRKTVDEVWTEIHRDAALRPQQAERVHPDSDTENSPRHPTFGEMTLEDFLIKAGVVREGYVPPGAPPQPVAAVPSALVSQQYAMAGYNDQHGLGAAAGGVPSAGYPLVGNNFGGRLGDGYGASGIGLPASPLSSDGMGGQFDHTVGGFIGDVFRNGGDCGVRKRLADGIAVDKVVERRQRRMIKNRESAARSRARKQAYTVELEAELNQLKEENARLREKQRRVIAIRKQLLVEAMAEQARANVQKSMRSTLRRCRSSTW